MADRLTLIGFEHSVYTWIVRLALAEMQLDAGYLEANPFSDDPDPILQQVTPFRRVPVLQHGTFTLTETTAILRYLDRLSSLNTCVPADAKAAARMDQVIGVVDAYVYPVLVREVFSAGYYLPNIEADTTDHSHIVAQGLKRAPLSLGLLDEIAQEGHQLSGDTISLADLHLAPMISYFVRVPEGAEMLSDYPALARWWGGISQRGSVIATDPFADH